MNNATIAATFDQIADLLEFESANPFRVRAYRNGARVIRDLSEPLVSWVADAEKDLTKIEGIGKDLADKITTLVETGELEQLNQLLERIPEDVLGLLRIPGLGPKKAAVLYHELGIMSLDALRSACEAGEVRKLKGFGEKTEQTILQGIDVAAKADDRIYWAEADAIVQTLRQHFSSCESIEALEFAGSYRRGRETVGDLDILAVSPDVSLVMDCFEAVPERQAVLARGDTKMSIRMQTGLQIDLRVVPAESFGAALQYFTGSKDHNVTLRGRARAKGLKINEYGVFDVSADDEKYLAGATEADVYATLDLPLFPPELREARKEFEWADQGDLPELIELKDIRGDLHMHTNETDGKVSLEEMVEVARQRGLKYIAITDHSKRVSMARGLDESRVRAQWKKIDRLNEKLDGQFTIFKGIECDILERGGMDLPDDVLAEADWVLASIHYGQNQSREQLTDRIVGAIMNPHVSAIAHPTGRVIHRREPYDVDMEAIFQAAKEHQTFLEMNASPKRLDLNDVQAAAAKSHGIKMVISTDAHSPARLSDLRYGVLQARRAGLAKADVVNTRTVKQFQKLLRSAS